MKDTYGICRIAIVSMRMEPDHRSEQVSQLLFGEHYSVVDSSEDKKWVRISCAYDEYEGWIQKEQFHTISTEYYDQIGNSNYKISTEISSSILFNKSYRNITIGSILPISTNELFETEQHLAFGGESKSLGQKRDADFLELIARKYLNTPYLWGGRSPFGIDCSGFTQMVYRICGYMVPRDSSMQLNAGKLVSDFSSIHPGDLAILKDENGIVDHVGILLSDNKIIHASGKVQIDKFLPEGIKNMDTKLVSHHLHQIRRVII